MLNKVVLMGRLAREPELQHTRQGVPVCTITLAVERDFADENGVREADFIDVVCWRGTAEFVSRWFRKGQLVAVEGRLSTRRWKDRYEQNRVAVEVIAESVYFAEKAERDGQAAPQQSAAPAAPQRGSRGPRQDLKPVDANRADVFRDEDGDYPGDLYRGGLPRGEFEELADDEDIPF